MAVNQYKYSLHIVKGKYVHIYLHNISVFGVYRQFGSSVMFAFSEPLQVQNRYHKLDSVH